MGYIVKFNFIVTVCRPSERGRIQYDNEDHPYMYVEVGESVNVAGTQLRSKWDIGLVRGKYYNFMISRDLDHFVSSV